MRSPYVLRACNMFERIVKLRGCQHLGLTLHRSMGKQLWKCADRPKDGPHGQDYQPWWSRRGGGGQQQTQTINNLMLKQTMQENKDPLGGITTYVASRQCGSTKWHPAIVNLPKSRDVASTLCSYVCKQSPKEHCRQSSRANLKHHVFSTWMVCLIRWNMVVSNRSEDNCDHHMFYLRATCLNAS